MFIDKKCVRCERRVDKLKLSKPTSAFDGAKPQHRAMPAEYIASLRSLGVSPQFLARLESEPEATVGKRRG